MDTHGHGWGLRVLDSIENRWGKISKNEVDRENSELGFFEIRFAGIDENKFFVFVPPSRSHKLGGEVLKEGFQKARKPQLLAAELCRLRGGFSRCPQFLGCLCQKFDARHHRVRGESPGFAHFLRDSAVLFGFRYHRHSSCGQPSGGFAAYQCRRFAVCLFASWIAISQLRLRWGGEAGFFGS